jgi:hypothetical protein
MRKLLSGAPGYVKVCARVPVSCHGHAGSLEAVMQNRDVAAEIQQLHEVADDMAGQYNLTPGQACSYGLTDDARVSLAGMLAAIVHMVDAFCTQDDGTVDSLALSANANAMRTLERHGLLKFIDAAGRRIIARWTHMASGWRSKSN